MNEVYSDNSVDGDIVIHVPVECIVPRGWGRLSWAWHALRGRAFMAPASVVITRNVVSGNVKIIGS